MGISSMRTPTASYTALATADDVMRDLNSWDSDPTRHGIYFDFDNGCRIGICGRRPYAAAFVKRGRFRRRIRAYRANRAEASFSDTNSLFKGDALFRRSRI